MRVCAFVIGRRREVVAHLGDKVCNVRPWLHTLGLDEAGLAIEDT